jgi:hypothetical protein
VKPPCAQRAQLQKDLEEAMRRYGAEVEKTKIGTFSVDPVEFKISQDKMREIKHVYKEALDAYRQHCKQHQCEDTGLIIDVK